MYDNLQKLLDEGQIPNLTVDHTTSKVCHRFVVKLGTLEIFNKESTEFTEDVERENLASLQIFIIGYILGKKSNE